MSRERIIFFQAIDEGNLEFVKFLVEHEHVYSIDVNEAISIAFKNNRLDIANYLKDNEEAIAKLPQLENSNFNTGFNNILATMTQQPIFLPNKVSSTAIELNKFIKDKKKRKECEDEQEKSIDSNESTSIQKILQEISEGIIKISEEEIDKIYTNANIPRHNEEGISNYNELNVNEKNRYDGIKIATDKAFNIVSKYRM